MNIEGGEESGFRRHKEREREVSGDRERSQERERGLRDIAKEGGERSQETERERFQKRKTF